MVEIMKKRIFRELAVEMLQRMDFSEHREGVLRYYTREHPYKIKGTLEDIILYHLGYCVTMYTNDTRLQSKYFKKIRNQEFKKEFGTLTLYEEEEDEESDKIEEVNLSPKEKTELCIDQFASLVKNDMKEFTEKTGFHITRIEISKTTRYDGQKEVVTSARISDIKWE